MLNIYVDESCQNGHQYMVLGGVCLKETDVSEVLTALHQIRRKHNIYGELKWTKASRAKLDAYIDFVDVFFNFAASDDIHFHSLCVDTTKLNHTRYNSGDSEIGFSKFIYQLLIKFGRLYSKYSPYQCYLDERTTNNPLSELQLILNNGISKKWNDHSKPFKKVVFTKSKASDLLQLNDILIGALSSRSNNHHVATGASPARSALSEHILNKAGISNPLADTPRRECRFTIWQFRLQ